MDGHSLTDREDGTILFGMNPKKSALLHASVLTAFLAIAPAPVADAEERKVPAAMVLTDQFGVEHRIGDIASRGAVVIVCSSERKSPEYLASWAAFLREALPGEASVMLAADLSGLPFFVPRAMVIANLGAKYPELPILLDWKGELRRILAPWKGEAVVIAYRDGKVVTRAVGLSSAAEASRIASSLKP
jgi:hypothetical protein